jgi:nitroreductase
MGTSHMLIKQADDDPRCDSAVFTGYTRDGGYATHVVANASFYHAPILVLISALEQESWLVENCSLAAQNMMLLAHSLGLGTCWIGFAQSYLNTREGKKLLGLSPAAVPVAPITVGYPKSIPLDVPRRDPQVRQIVQWCRRCPDSD